MKGGRPNHVRNEIRLPDDIGHGHRRRIYSLPSMVFVSVPENQRRGDSGKFMISQHSASGQFASDRENALGPSSFGQDTRSWLQFRPGPVVSNMYLGSAPGFLIADSLVSDSDVSADRCKHDIATHDLWCCTGFTSLLHVDVLSW